MTETAQEAYKRLLRDVVAPALRRERLPGSGSSYLLPDPASWAQIGFQRSMSSTRDVVKFTVNLKVTDKEWWDEQRRAHSPMKDTPPSGTDRTKWDAERLERSAYRSDPAPRPPVRAGSSGSASSCLTSKATTGGRWARVTRRTSSTMGCGR